MSSITQAILTQHEAAARELLRQIEAQVLERMPDLTIVPAPERRRYTSAASLPDDFLETIALSIDDSPELGVPSRLTGLDLRNVIGFSRAYLMLADQLETLVLNIRATVMARRYDVGHRALGVYGTAKSINRPNLPPVIPNLPSMRRTLGRTGLRKKPVTPPADEQAKLKS